MTDELLPPDPSKDGWYWVTSDDDGATFPLAWVAWRNAWEYGADVWSPGATLNCGYRLASPHSIPTPAEVTALHALREELANEIAITRKRRDRYTLGGEEWRKQETIAAIYERCAAMLRAALGIKP